MTWKRQFARLRGVFGRRRRESEFRNEIRAHIAMEEEENVEAGMPPEEAHYAALRRFGNMTLAQERSREMWAWNWVETFLQDIRYGLRQLRRSPGFAAVAVLTMALGIGANTAIFSLIDAVMLRSLPVRDPAQLVLLNWKKWKGETTTSVLAVESDNGSPNAAPFSYPAFQDLRTHSRVFASLFGFVSLGTAEVRISGQTHLAQGEMVTGNYFSGLGVSPTLGRAITDDDQKPGAPLAAVISYGYWSRQFGRSPKVVGKGIAVDGVPFTIVGVAPPEFFGVQPGRAVDVWVPLVENPKLLPYGMDSTPGGRSLFTSRDWWWLVVMGRLKPGVRRLRATAELKVLFNQIVTAGMKTPPKPHSIPQIWLDPAGNGLALLRQQFSEPLWILMMLVGVVLLIACANVAGLLVARSTVRQKEIAVRLSLGAPRTRLIRQLLTESVLLAGMGGALGLLFAGWGSRALVLLMSSGSEPLSLSVHLSARILAFTAAVVLATGVSFGIAPALWSTRVDLTPSLKATAGGVSTTSQRSRLGLGKSLVVAQVALSVLLMVGAGLFVRTLVNLEDQNLGFNPHRLLLFEMDPTTHGYKGARLISFYRQLLERFQALPGVKSATLSEVALISGTQNAWVIALEGQKPANGHSLGAQFNDVGPAFFKTLGMRLLLGRGVEWRDTTSSPKVAVVNEAFARHFLGGRDPIGHRFRFDYYHFKAGDFSPAYEIVGVVQDARYASVRRPPRPTIYLPYSQGLFPIGGTHFELRTAGNPLALAPVVRRVVHDLDPDVPVSEFKTQTEQIGETLVQERLFVRLSSFFGGLAVLLACIGLYGLMAFAVTRRTNEIGIRVALGAEPRKILRMLMLESLAVASAGIAIGIAAVLAAMRLVSSLLYGLKPSDPVTIAAAAGVMLAVAALASFLPARRAAKVDPIVALRYE